MSKKTTLRIATRKSMLALWQTEYVKQLLLHYHPELTIELVPLLTKGDKYLGGPLSKMGGKGSFIKELEEAIYAGEADIAVHSMKDVPMTLPTDLELAVMCERGDPRDAFVSQHYSSFSALPSHGRVGTSSMRRQRQLAALRPDLNLINLRGNVNSRLQKLAEGEFDAIILAAAGLERLNETQHIQHYFSPEEMLPSPGQGAIGIECRKEDTHILELLEPLNHAPTALTVNTERMVSKLLGGSCQLPLAAYATLDSENLMLTGLVACPDTFHIIKSQITGAAAEWARLGQHVADDLLAQGADKILKKIGIAW